MSLHWIQLHKMTILFLQPANTSLKDYGRFQKDGELKVLSHSDNRQRNRLVFVVTDIPCTNQPHTVSI